MPTVNSLESKQYLLEALDDDNDDDSDDDDSNTASWKKSVWKVKSNSHYLAIQWFTFLKPSSFAGSTGYMCIVI